MTGPSSAVDRDVDRTRRASAAFAWLTLFFAFWLVGAITAAARALVQGPDWPTVQQAIDIFNLGVIALGVVCLAVVVRARARSRPVRRAFPRDTASSVRGSSCLSPGRRSIGAGSRAWPSSMGIEETLGPSWIVIFIGLVLVACGPLRAAISSPDANVPRWAAVLSASLCLSAALIPGGFHPAANPWLEHVSAVGSGEMLGHGCGRLSPDQADRSSGEPGGPWNVAWSPDGAQMAFSMVRVGPNSPVDDDADLWLADADGSNARPIVEGAGLNGSRTGHRMASGSPTRATPQADPGWPAVQPAPRAGLGSSGSASCSAAPHRSGSTPTSGDPGDGTGSPEQLTDVAGDDRAASYSPDGSKLVFDSSRDGPTAVYVMDADGSNAHRLTSGADDWGASWSPDGTKIAYSIVARPSGPGPADLGHRRRRWGADAGDERPGRPSSAELVAGWVAHRLHPDDGADRSDLVHRRGWQRSEEFSNDPRAGTTLVSGGDAWSRDGRIVYVRGEEPPVDADPLVREISPRPPCSSRQCSWPWSRSSPFASSHPSVLLR